MQTIEQALQQAVAHHQAGELQEAEKGYQAILHTEPLHPKANHNLGALYVQIQQPAAGLPFFVAAIEADPAHGQYWLSYIDALHLAGQSEEARQVLALARQSGLQGDDVDALEASLEGAGQSVAGYQPESPGKNDQPKPAQQSNSPHQQEISTLIALFTQGRYEDVLPLAQAMTRRFPQYGFGWKLLGVVCKQLGMNAEALAPMQKAVELLPNDAEAHSNLGGTLQSLGRLNEAEETLSLALRMNPDNADALFNLGITLQGLDRLDEAERSYRKALQVRPDYAEVHGSLGAILQATGRPQEALTHFQQRTLLAPGNPVDQHLIASLTGKNTERAPAKYIQDVFDSYAEKFDTHLQQVLQYDVPKKLSALIGRYVSDEHDWNVLDLGCGTGLMGAEIAPFAKCLVGVDLSAKMLEQAHARKLYQRLEQSDLLPMMQAEPASSFDVIVAADVFVYLGRLDEVIVEIKRILRPDGFFAFSVEDFEASQSDAVAPDKGQEYQLKNTGRYGHSVQYLARLASENNFQIREVVATQTRIDHGKPIEGHICVWNMEPF